MQNSKKPRDEWKSRSEAILAQGFPATNSKRWTHFIEGIFPTHTDGTGSGCYLFDFNGNRYLDFISALGALSLGYSNGKVIEAVIRQAARGASHSLPTSLEVECAERLSALVPPAERIRFLKNGDDASRAAIRISRTYTNRSLVLSDGYHGHSDLFTSLTPPAHGVKDHHEILPLEENRGKLCDAACVIVEALKLSDGPEYKEWITNLRNECKVRGVVFIIDEIVTGTRVPKLTVSNWWNLDPDIILLGKGIANGFPLSIVAGKREIMNCGEYFVSTTFGGEAVSLAACMATLGEIEKKNLDDLMFYGKRIQQKLNSLHEDIKFTGWGTRAQFSIGENSVSNLFAQEACRAGILFGRAFFWNFSHLEANIEQMVLDVASTIVERINRGEVQLLGKPPVFSFKR